jgi:hypothetical protein
MSSKVIAFCVSVWSSIWGKRRKPEFIKKQNKAKTKIKKNKKNLDIYGFYVKRREVVQGNIARESLSQIDVAII